MPVDTWPWLGCVSIILYAMRSWLVIMVVEDLQYNTSWGTETPPGTSQQANYEAHGRLMLKANIFVIVPYPNHLYHTYHQNK